MKKCLLLKATIRGALTAIASIAAMAPAGAQTTNWIAFNDHRPGPLIPPHVPTQTSWGTHVRASILDLGAAADSSGNLINFLTGDPLTAAITVTRTVSPDDFPTVTLAGIPQPGTPAHNIFYGKCDLSNNGIVGVDKVDNDIVTITFSGLDPTKRYIFRGTAARGGSYSPRWTVATITNVNGYINAHLNGTGPGVITSNDFPANLGPGQAAYNSGHNAQGAVIGWDDIAPLPNGTFQIVQEQYVGPTPGGGQATDANYGYAFGAILLAEVESVAPTITANPPALTDVQQNRPFSLSVAATGVPLRYQWYKEGSGEVAGATFSTYSVSQAQVADSGRYYAVVYNSLARRTSSVAQVNVTVDNAAPTVESIFSYPTVDAGGIATLDQIIIEFNEPVTPGSVSSPASYTVSGGGNPVSVIVTNERSVVLKLGFPLTENTDYTVTLSGATDVVGNVAGSSSAPFHSWVSGEGNGLLMESYNSTAAVDVESLLASPDYPNNPFRSDTLRAFDSRLVFPDDTREAYGARIRGVFIPPVSGNWVFYFRTRNLGVVNFNPNGTTAAGAIEILRQSTENAPFNWDKFSSLSFSLRAGRGYYIEGLYKGGAGEDYIKVAARLAGTGFPTPVDSPNTDAPDASSLAGAPIAFPLAPRDLGGTLTIAQNLADRTADENNPTTLSVGLSNPSGLPLHYQWFRNGSPIAGATTPTYTLLPTVADDNGATFSVRVSKYGSSVTSRTATLTVVPDTTGPLVLEAFSTNLTHVVVRFNELLERFSAEEPFSYAVLPDNLATLATLEPNGTTVIVQLTTPLITGETYQIRIENVTDRAINPMTPNPATVTFVAGLVGPRLRIERSGNQVTLSWPVPATPFVLEETTALVEPVASIVWTPVTATPTVVAGRNTVTLNVASGSRIYRLKQ